MPLKKLEKSSDEKWMRLALEEAVRAAECGEVPIGAVAVRNGELLARAHNRSIELSDPTAHAEVLVLRQAGRRLGNYRLVDVELFVTIEPCAMCAGAAVWARIPRLVFGASDAKAGAVESKARLLTPGRFNHDVQFRGGLLSEACRDLMQEFFASRR